MGYSKKRMCAEMKKKLILYSHTGSKNHGCEAIVRSTLKILSAYDHKLFSEKPDEEYLYGINDLASIEKSGEATKRYTFTHILNSLFYRVFKSRYLYNLKMNKHILQYIGSRKLALSIGGDMYCYKYAPEMMEMLNNKLNKKGIKTVLWGCSIEPELLTNKNIVNDLKKYSLITPRETITYNALINAGVTKNTRLYPDPAFQLDLTKLPLPEGFIENNTIGINLSPLIMQYEKNSGLAYLNCERLIEYIIEKTPYQIALIPHVVFDNADDRIPLKKLFEKYENSGRIILLNDFNCMELKGFISRCRMFIGARTHATIAAYSTCVPTLVIGYSVKARGIATDIFGTAENYVLPVQALSDSNQLISSFEWLRSHENDIRKQLTSFMPSYCKKVLEAGEEIDKLMA